MKTLLLPLVFCLIMTGLTTAQNVGPVTDYPDATARLDSIYDFDWTNGNWNINTKNYKVYNTDGTLSQDLYKKINPLTQDWTNYLRYMYDYNGDTYPNAVTGQMWTLEGNWVTSQYTHYFLKALPDTFYQKNWNQLKQKFVSGVKDVYTIDENKNVTSRVSMLYDTLTDEFYNSVKYSYSYDLNGKKTQEVYQIWGDTSWINNYKKFDTYDSVQQLVLHEEYAWIDSTQSWLTVSRTKNEYNVAGRIFYSLTQSWNDFSQSWDSIQQVDYIYNGDGWLLNQVANNMNPYTLTWLPYSLTGYSYFENGKVRTKNIDLWNPNLNTWANTNAVIYDSVTQIIDEINRFLDYTTYEITAGTHVVNTWNSESNPDQIITQSWNTSTGEWVNQYQTNYTYNNDNQITEKVVKEWQNDWVNKMMTRYYYTNSIGIPEKEGSVCSFANPLRAGSTFSCGLLERDRLYLVKLISMSGAVVWKADFTGGAAVTIPSSVANGMYLLNISNQGKNISSQKVIITR